MGRRVAARLLWFVYALAAALLAAVFFHRFDPARERFARKRNAFRNGSQWWSCGGEEPGAGRSVDPPADAARVRGRKESVLCLIAAELRLMLQGHRWWCMRLRGRCLSRVWRRRSRLRGGGVILAAWIWPLLIWSQMGGREARYATGC